MWNFVVEDLSDPARFITHFLLYLSRICFLNSFSVHPSWLAMRAELSGAYGRLLPCLRTRSLPSRASLSSLLGNGRHYDTVLTVYRLLSAAQCPEGIARLILD
jgi:hypothetical protein